MTAAPGESTASTHASDPLDTGTPGCGTELRPADTAGVPAAAPADTAAGERLLNELVADSLRYRQSAEFKRLLMFIRGFRSYKPFNGLLVDVQKRGSTFVARLHGGVPGIGVESRWALSRWSFSNLSAR